MPAAQALTPRKPLQHPASTVKGSDGPRADSLDSIRLHITPFNPSLLSTIIPPSLLPSATNIAYHTVQTFPEKGFGYVELPAMEAQKLKKKLNGSILKGTKVRIEEARPEKRKSSRGDTADEPAEVKDKERPRKKAKKSKREEGVLPGYELPGERHVKRGWTEPAAEVKAKKHKKDKDKDKGKKEKGRRKHQVSQYTNEPEMLFRTKLPPNAVSLASDKENKSERKARKKFDRDVVVHEFERTTKHAGFLKSNQIPKDSKAVSEYVEGKGWVDDAGNVIETESKPRRRTRKNDELQISSDGKPLTDEPSSQDRSTKTNGTAKTSTSKRTTSTLLITGETDEETEESTVESSSDAKNGSDDNDEAEEDEKSPATESRSESQEIATSKDSIAPETAKLQVDRLDTPPSRTGNEEAAREVHPLEALFKRPKLTGSESSRLAPIDTSFSFFDAEADKHDTAMNPPHTPFTKQDLHFRGMRSAAPTPDTAAISRRFPFSMVDDAGDHEEEEVDDNMGGAGMADADVFTSTEPKSRSMPQERNDGNAKTESDFAKWFWEHRGDTNRAWKKRRREALKQKRQRENRRLSRRNV